MGAMKTILLMIVSAIMGVVVFVVGVLGWLTYRVNSGGGLPSISFSSQPRSPRTNETTVAGAPEIKPRFLGSGGMFTGGFTSPGQVLAAGPGTIAGTVRVDDKPAAGLRVRLALNGSVMSQWSEVDSAGRYAVSVPYGNYRIDGYELDYNTTNAVLGGKTDSPRNNRYRDGDVFQVAEGRPGAGPELQYIDPLVKTGPKGPVSASQPVVLEWRPYPNAKSYRVQVTGRADEEDYTNQVQAFGWRDRPVVSGTSFDLARHGVKLKVGYVYTVDITALDAEGRTLVESSRTSRSDFKVTE
jgi:hypothetical protein